MNIEERLTNTFNDVLRTSGYIFEIINNSKRQSNYITGPNSQLISDPVAKQLAQSIAQFDQILDETVSKFNDARWCVEQIVDNRQKQEELKAQEELERQKRAQLEKTKKEEEEAARRKKDEEERLLKETRAKELEKHAREKEQQQAKEREEKERLEKEILEKKKEEKKLDEKERELRWKEDVNANVALDGSANATSSGRNNGASMLGGDFDLDLDLGKNQDILNPSDILSTIDYKDGAPDDNNNKLNSGMDNMDLDFDAVLNGGPLDGLNMDLLDQEFDSGQGMEEEFDVDTFLNQIGNGD